jgi:hypothetical protein
MGQLWTKEEICAAVAMDPHQSTQTPEVIVHFAVEVAKKVRTKQARIVSWDKIKDDPPSQLKISLIVAIPHKSKAFCSMSFRHCLANRGVRTSVNDTTKKTAPAVAINQIRECFARIVHALTETGSDAKVFMAKWA